MQYINATAAVAVVVVVQVAAAASTWVLVFCPLAPPQHKSFLALPVAAKSLLGQPTHVGMKIYRPYPRFFRHEEWVEHYGHQEFMNPLHKSLDALLAPSIMQKEHPNTTSRRKSRYLKVIKSIYDP